jgi:ABC-type anion transport system duplicated permease subunit
MKIAWKLLVAAGVLLAMIAVGTDTTVGSGLGGRVHNLGLQQQQLMLLIVGCAMFLAGIVVFGIAKLKQTPEEDQKEREKSKETESKWAPKAWLTELNVQAKPGTDELEEEGRKVLARDRSQRVDKELQARIKRMEERK